MTRTTKRRLIALGLPIPVIGGVVLTLWSLSLWKWLMTLAMIPYGLVYAISIAMDRWFGGDTRLGVPAHVVGISAAVGVWYLLLAAASQAVLCPRDRVSRAVFSAAVVAGVLMALVAWSLRGFDPD